MSSEHRPASPATNSLPTPGAPSRSGPPTPTPTPAPTSAVRLWVVLLLLAGPLTAQQLPWPFSLSREPYQELGNRGYAVAALGLLEREHEAGDLGPMQSVVPDLLAAELVHVGAHRQARLRDAAFRDLLGHPPTPWEGSLDDWRARPVREVLAGLWSDRRVVLFNEEHRSARQRALLHGLLDDLAAAGFTHLACETLAHDAGLHERGHPTVADGTYSRDPVYGALLRRALELGLAVVPYEATAAQRAGADPTDPLAATNRREQAQAENLAALLEDPAVRLVVLAGRHHIVESGGGDWTPMGGLLAELAGVDPLSVDLMLMEQRARPDLEHPARRAALAAGLLGDEPVVLVDGAGAPFTTLPGGLDLVVFLPDEGDLSGRPDWLTLGGTRRPVPVAPPAVSAAHLLQALHAGEDQELSVPADQVLVLPGEEDEPTLLLAPGAYVLRLLDGEGQVVWQAEQRVTAAAPREDPEGAGAR